MAKARLKRAGSHSDRPITSLYQAITQQEPAHDRASRNERPRRSEHPVAGPQGGMPRKRRPRRVSPARAPWGVASGCIGAHCAASRLRPGEPKKKRMPTEQKGLAPEESRSQLLAAWVLAVPDRDRCAPTRSSMPISIQQKIQASTDRPRKRAAFSERWREGGL